MLDSTTWSSEDKWRIVRESKGRGEILKEGKQIYQWKFENQKLEDQCSLARCWMDPVLRW
jgi:hypothetical protein